MRVTALRIALLGSFEPGARERIEPALSLLPRTAIVDRDERWNADWPQRAASSDLCVVFQSWPDEIPVRTAHALIAACSAGRLICCQGAWCASAGRTRATWPPAVCVPIEQLASRIAFELDVLAGRHPPLPATASRDEAFAAHYAISPDVDPVPVRVESPDSAYARELQHALNPSNIDEQRRVTIRDVDVASDDPHHGRDPASIPVAGFPRSGQSREGESSESRAIVPKLAPLSELQSAIQHAVDGHS